MKKYAELSQEELDEGFERVMRSLEDLSPGEKAQLAQYADEAIRIGDAE